MQDDAPNYLSTSQVAERLKVNGATVNRWVAEGRLVPAFTAPGARGARFFAPAAVERLAEERREELLAMLPDSADAVAAS